MTRLGRRTLVSGLARFAASAAGLALLSKACVVPPFSATSRKVPRIGYLSPGPRASRAAWVDAFLNGLQELGYVEGSTITIDWRFAPQGSDTRFAEMAVDLVHLPVDLIVVAGSTPAARAARKATSSIPIVAGVSWPVESGLVASLARPGANITGVSATAPGFHAKQLDLLRDIVPGLHRCAALVDAGNPVYDRVGWAEVGTAADVAGLEVERIDLRSPADLETAMEAAASSRVQAVIDLENPPLLPVRDRYAALALQHRLPCITQPREYLVSGHALAYGPNNSELHRRLATYVDKVLRGANPSDLPVEQTTVWDLYVNMTTLRTLGLSIPPSVLPLVTEWIQ